MLNIWHSIKDMKKMNMMENLEEAEAEEEEVVVEVEAAIVVEMTTEEEAEDRRTY